MKAWKKDSDRRLYERRKSEGQCVVCGKPERITDLLYCGSCQLKKRASLVQCRNRLKETVYQAYGGKCSCCGEHRQSFLSIDHVNGDGNIHRRELVGANHGGSRALYSWAIKNNYPDSIRLLCHNCNIGRERTGGICEHETERNS